MKFEIAITVITIVLLSAFIYQGALGKVAPEEKLKVIVKISYSDFVKHEGTGKAVFDYMNDRGFKASKQFPTDQFPKSITIEFPKGKVKVGGWFQICLSSYKWDEGSCSTGANGPNKEPEHVSLRFPV
jgi:hypothetical protein